MSELTPDLTRKFIAAVEKMPAFPKSVQRILELSRDIDCSPKELVAVIEKDPVMTMKLLRVLNSAYYSFPKQITSVNQAVVYLGLNTIKNMALSFAAIGVLPHSNGAGFDMQRYLQHSLATASLARLVALKFRVKDADPADCYIAGLLHDFGKVVFAQFMTDEFRQVLHKSEEEAIPLYLAEQAVIGSDHTVVGAMLVEKWQFPSGIAGLILEHHRPPDTAEGVGVCLFIANQISKHLGLGTHGGQVAEPFPDIVADRFGGELEDVIADLGDLSGLADEVRLYANIGKESSV